MVVSGLATGSIYALMALSLVIIYNATRTLNFAQGEMLMVSTFVAWSAQRALGAAAARRAAGGGGGRRRCWRSSFERLVIRRAIGATHWDVLIITLGLSLILRAGAGIVWTHDEFPFPSFFSNRPIALGPGAGGAGLARHHRRLARRSCWRWPRSSGGRAWAGRCARWPRTSARRGSWASASSACTPAPWVLAAVVGAVAGVLVAPVIFLSSKMGLVVINGFTAAVLGGFGSMPGAVAGRHAARRAREPGAALSALGHPLLGAVPRPHRASCSCARPACWAGSSGGRCEARGPRWRGLLLSARAGRGWRRATSSSWRAWSLVNAVVAIGLNLLSGYTNQLSFGHAGFLAIGAYTAALLTIHAPAVPVVVTLARPAS